jgi:DNA-binding response OmpR family regulator
MNCRFVTASLVGTLLFCGLALAQVQVETNLSDEQLWTDSIYYLKIGRIEYGQAYLKAYIDRKVDPVKTLQFSEKDPRSIQILTRLQTDAKLGDLARAALDQVDKGWQERRRDIPRIDVEIERLAGTARAQFQATERLKETGEYAVPVILKYLSDESKSALHAKLIDALAAMGPSVVEPLVAAVPYLPQSPKLLVIDALGRLDYAQSLPYLKEMVQDTKSAPVVKAAAQRAIECIVARNPKYCTSNDAAQAFYDLALRYYYRDSAIKPGAEGRVAGLEGDVAADQPNLWLWKDGQVVPQPAPWELYYELMTMRMTRRSLELDNSVGQRDALTLWLMANAKRASKLSETLVDPMHSEEFPSVEYFYRSAGAQYSLAALSRALQDNDLVNILASLKALREVASGNAILQPVGDIQPIVTALAYQNQLVRTNAALALGWAAPCDKYPGATEVTAVLGTIIDGLKQTSALVITGDKKKLAGLTELAKAGGYSAQAAKNFEQANKIVGESAASIDLIVLDYALTTPGANQTISMLRENALLRNVPVLVFVVADKLAEAKAALVSQAGIAIIPEGASAEVVADKLAGLKKALGRVAVASEEAADDALLAAESLEILAGLKAEQYNVELARESLIKAMNGEKWDLALASAKVLAKLCSAQAQQALADAALVRKDVEQKVTLLNLLGEAARDNGNKLKAAQVESFQKLLIDATDTSIRKATAKVLGSLNLEPKVARKVILARDPFGSIE